MNLVEPLYQCYKSDNQVIKWCSCQQGWRSWILFYLCISVEEVMEKRNRNNTFKVRIKKVREFMVDNFYINTSHISVYIYIYITNYIQTSTLSNYSTIQMNGYRSHCIKIKNGMNRRLRLFIFKSANCAEPQVPTKPSEDSVWSPCRNQLLCNFLVNVPGQKTRKLSTRKRW